eukprot:maker-scaffold876_size86062-snap-gene-0.24 protein:Tk10525 transcript:maker-scaffold876_size86062-snap-gene-0.24-mRNA-1 annotation:"probable dna mismatch repair protein msh6-like"
MSRQASILTFFNRRGSTPAARGDTPATPDPATPPPAKRARPERSESSGVQRERGAGPGAEKENTPDTPTRASSARKTPRSQPAEAAEPATERSEEAPESGLGREFPHLSLAFLGAGRRDGQGRAADDPSFDAGTCQVPAAYLAQQTPGQRQWWDLKARHFDTVLLFKMGKFYELFHMDAVIGVRECGMTLMKKDMAHCGFPESALERYVHLLVDRGYKLARIEQTETPQMMSVRVQRERGVKAVKAVRREVCQIMSSGTRVNSVEHEDCLLLIHGGTAGSDGTRPVGVSVFQPSLNRIFVGSLESGQDTAEILTLLQVARPTEVVAEPDLIATWQDVIKAFQPLRLSWRPSPALDDSAVGWLTEARYGTDPDWYSLAELMDRHADLLGRKEPLTREAFIGLASVLKDGLIDQTVLTQGEILPLVDILQIRDGQSLQYYGNALHNLDILPSKPGQKGLIHVLDRTITPCGKRMFRQWMAHPLANGRDILARQKMIMALSAPIVSDCRARLKGLGDLEKHLARICIMGFKAKDHPDNRAILYESKQSQRLAKSLECSLQGIETYADVLCTLLSECSAHPPHDTGNATLVKARDKCQEFNQFLDTTNGEATLVIPKGFSQMYDEALDAQEDVLHQAEECRLEQVKRFGSNAIKFWGSGSSRFQIEVPDKLVSKVTAQHTMTSQKKGVKRYSTPETRALCDRLEEAEMKLKSMHEDVISEMVNMFSVHKDLWHELVKSVARVDCLFSLYLYNESESEEKVLPKVLLHASEGNRQTGETTIDIVGGKHPILTFLKAGQADSAVIPNDIRLGVEMFVLTGPNMGGKSTLMRQTALLVSLAQMGVKVPAQSMTLHPVDKIFSRMGASDDIFEGKSTFLMELLETATVFQNMTQDSLVLIDELGRGTSTYDGCAIALATLKYLAGKCRGLFSTHYHEMFRVMDDIPQLSLHFMDFMRQGEDIVFLYKLKEGRCTESHGLNVAKMAGIPEGIIQRASAIAISSAPMTKA